MTNVDDYYNAQLAELIGRTLVSVVRNGDVSIDFEDTSGNRWRMYYEPDCCARCDIEDVAGDLDDLVGSPIVIAEAVCNSEDPPPADEKYVESFTWTFYKLATANGHVTIRWFGQSNGYYSERAAFRRIGALS